ncbi:efflux RND transporter periplasmic adaptor subunit [Hoeflea olei]|uniref:Uncharacterized protein n=1 Tax=Hoeflea olei TaxID=1480615 RepID=A0A1C1YQP5_9HYPH|nr:efflux RND transporter periplasmic adaptor subunit [Hoeflea olei]OCW55828.1 hypothetical protein AWJ14_15225 [Hoeflea olei]
MPPSKSDIEAIVKTSKKRSPLRSWPVWLVLLLVLAGALWYWRAADARQAQPSYVTAPVERADIVVQVTATGTVEPTGQVEISSELSGTVRAVEVDFNDTVHKGQVLALLDTDKLEANVELSRASLVAAQARLADARATLAQRKDAYDRAVMLKQRNVASEENLTSAKADYERAEAAVKSAEADIRVADANLKINETNLGKACICSSIDGVVLDRNVEVGQIVASSLQAPVLFTLAADLTKMELRVDIDEADIGKVKVGNAAMFTVEAYQGQSFPAVISQLRYAPKTVEGVVTYEAILSIDNAELLLRPGMTATADIKVAEVRDTLVIPNAALRYAPPAKVEGRSGSGLLGVVFKGPPSMSAAPISKPGVDGHRDIWVLRNGVAVAVPVIPGETDGSKTAITGEVEQGDLVITDLSTP